MQEAEVQQFLLDHLDHREDLAQEYKELKENPLFQRLILQGYLGKLFQLEGLVLEAVGRGEDLEDLSTEYQQRLRFKQYLEYLESGENSWFYKEMHRKLQGGSELSATDIEAIKTRVYRR